MTKNQILLLALESFICAFGLIWYIVLWEYPKGSGMLDLGTTIFFGFYYPIADLLLFFIIWLYLFLMFMVIHWVKALYNKYTRHTIISS